MSERGCTDKALNEILEFIIRFMQEKGYSPALWEIAEGIDCASSVVFYKLRLMQKLGMIDCIEASPRTITVPGYGYRKIQEEP